MLKIFIFLTILYLTSIEPFIYAQQSIDKKYERNAPSILNIIDSTKIKQKDVVNSIGISTNRDTIIITRHGLKPVIVDLTKQKINVIKMFKDADIGIDNPSWSQDGKWLSFRTFSNGGHSPLTTTHTWVVDSSGNNLQKIILPDPYGKFSDSIVKWQGGHDIVLEGLEVKYEGNQWKEFNAKFDFDCDTKVLTHIE